MEDMGQDENINITPGDGVIDRFSLVPMISLSWIA